MTGRSRVRTLPTLNKLFENLLIWNSLSVSSLGENLQLEGKIPLATLPGQEHKLKYGNEKIWPWNAQWQCRGQGRRFTNVRCHAIAFFQLSSVTAKSSLNNNPRSPGLVTAAAEDGLNKFFKAILGFVKGRRHLFVLILSLVLTKWWHSGNNYQRFVSTTIAISYLVTKCL